MSDEKATRNRCSRSELELVENPVGIQRTTLAYNAETMLCHFIMKKGAEIPLHDHAAVQNGYVISGRVQFRDKDGDAFIAETGSGYAFSSHEQHGALVLEDAEVIECFAPMRPEYADN
jgi:quercetin dioxygenase-like cupin family protein